MSPPSSSIDPSSYSVLGLTHVQYDHRDPFAKALALITLSPIFLLCSYVTIMIYRRELTFINALLGQLGCEGINWGLKRLIRQPRPTGNLGSGYGMPSSHAQFVGFFAAYFLAHFALHHPKSARPATLVNTMRRFEHAVAMLAIAGCAAVTAYSRYHLSYHSAAQIWVGLSLGIVIGAAWYYIAEYLPRKPLRLPAPLGTPAQSPVNSRRKQATRAPAPQERLGSPFELRQRLRRKGDSDVSGAEDAGQIPPVPSQLRTHARRRSSLSSFLPELHPAPPLRQLILDHPIAVAFRIRDSWTVWLDGGIEQEYGRWRDEWIERRREWREEDALIDEDAVSPVRSVQLKQPTRERAHRAEWSDPTDEVHYRRLLKTLALADQCVPNQTAFCVGCVISTSVSPHPSGSSSTSSEAADEIELATGYSRELPGNTHAEECALHKLCTGKLEDSLGAWANREKEEVSLDLYTSMEPCSIRTSGNASCVSRILNFNSVFSASSASASTSASASRVAPRARINRIFMGVREPQDFVQCEGVRMLRSAGIEVRTVLAPSVQTQTHRLRNGWLEREALRIAKKSHADQPASEGAEKMWRRNG